MPAFQKLKDKMSQAFNAVSSLGVKEYSFENAGKTATVRTRNLGVASSYTMTYADKAANLSGENYEFSLFKNVTAKGVRKGKDFCGVT